MLVTAVLVASCSKTPAAPTPPPPPPPPPVANPPSLACVEGLSRSTANATGMAVTFDTPAASDGQGSVTVSCSPASGENFPIGSTSVTCTATDSLSRTGTCSFSVTVSRLPTVQRVKYLAFGDSNTQGEVSPPVSGVTFPTLFTKNAVVASAAWPTVLQQSLRGRYSSQSSSLVVSNFGLAGERARDARTRYQQALNSDRPEVVMILHGHNDITGGLDGAASTAAFEIEQMVSEARNRGMRVFLSTVLPARPGGNKAIAQLFIDDFNARMRIVASRQGVTLVDNYAALRTDVNRYIGVDGLHATEAGYTKIADTFFQAIQAALEVR
ncbi:MAG TPA: GDSL-type esterase/lipase family protein [Vicinamibacterales bacterium]|nr:GDSL-type esterase/lipase family protein [Vicinamibacterales bacterium]